MLSLIEIGPGVLEKKILKILSMYFRYFVKAKALAKVVALHLNKLESTSIQR